MQRVFPATLDVSREEEREGGCDGVLTDGGEAREGDQVALQIIYNDWCNYGSI